MENRAKYYASLRTGRSVYLCESHISKVARRIDDVGRMALKRGVRSIGSLNPYTPKKCAECRQHPNQ